MKCSIVTLIVGICCHWTIAQTPNADSIQSELNALNGVDKLELLKKLMKSHLCRDNAQVFHYYDQIQQELVVTPHPEIEIEAMKDIGTATYCAGKIDSALVIYGQAAAMARQHDTKKLLGALEVNIASMSRLKGEFDTAIYHYNKSLNISRQINDTVIMLATLDGMGVIHQKMGRYDSALNNFLQVEKIALATGQTRLLMASRLNKLTIQFKNQPEEIDTTEVREMINYAIDQGHVINIASGLQMMGGIQLLSGNHTAAIKSFNEGLDILEGVHTGEVYDYLLQGAGHAYHELGNFEKAIEYNQRAIENAKNSGNLEILPLIYGNLASNYLQLGMYDQTLTYAQNSLDAFIEKEEESLYGQYNTYQYMAQAYAAKGQYDKAFEAQKKYTTLFNQFRDKSQTELLTEMQTKYETEKKENEIEKLSQQATIQALQISRQRYLTLGLSAVLIIIIGGSVLIYRQRKLKQDRELANLELAETKKRLEVEKQYRDAELKALRSQMNPHFIFNALNSIQEYIVTNEKKLAGRYLGKFADLMRMYLGHSQSQQILVQEEIDALSIYLELEKVRFNDTLDFEIVTSQIDGADLMSIPPLLIQPFVENALKHGLLHKPSDRKLIVSFSNQGDADLMTCTVEDNGIGRTKSAEINQMRRPDHQSFATSAINTRLELMNEGLDHPISVETVDLQDASGASSGTRVVLKIPVLDS